MRRQSNLKPHHLQRETTHSARRFACFRHTGINLQPSFLSPISLSVTFIRSPCERTGDRSVLVSHFHLSATILFGYLNLPCSVMDELLLPRARQRGGCHAWLERNFRMAARGSSLRTEVIAGLVDFLGNPIPALPLTAQYKFVEVCSLPNCGSLTHASVLTACVPPRHHVQCSQCVPPRFGTPGAAPREPADPKGGLRLRLRRHCRRVLHRDRPSLQPSHTCRMRYRVRNVLCMYDYRVRDPCTLRPQRTMHDPACAVIPIYSHVLTNAAEVLGTIVIPNAHSLTPKGTLSFCLRVTLYSPLPARSTCSTDCSHITHTLLTRFARRLAGGGGQPTVYAGYEGHVRLHGVPLVEHAHVRPCAVRSVVAAVPVGAEEREGGDAHWARAHARDVRVRADAVRRADQHQRHRGHDGGYNIAHRHIWLRRYGAHGLPAWQPLENGISHPHHPADHCGVDLLVDWRAFVQPTRVASRSHCRATGGLFY